ncbi:MAG: phosphatase PAP2 family protein [Alphaproteobacteria bacterium]|nr:phosphatase PAP2 family protein [Alphaproteobacteria bacterium]
MTRRLPLFLTAALFCAALSCGLTAPAAAAWWTDPNPYVDPALLPPALLPPPPAEGSPAWRLQTDGVIAAQRLLSAGTIADIRNEQHIRVGLVTSVLEPAFTPARFPKTFALLNRVFANVTAVTETDKQFWHTRRPYLTDNHVKLYVDRLDDSPSYPSGHTSESRTVAEVLGMLFPEKRDALRARADQIATDRIKAGAHYPVDIAAGRALAMMMIGALMNDADFRADLAAARAEIAAVKPAP